MPEIIDIAGELRHETKPKSPDEGAFLIFDGSKEVWLPKSLVEYDGKGTFSMPMYLAKNKGLI